MTPASVTHGRIILQESRKFVPFSILAGRDDSFCLELQALENDDFLLQFSDGAGSRGRAAGGGGGGAWDKTDLDAGMRDRAAGQRSYN